MGIRSVGRRSRGGRRRSQSKTASRATRDRGPISAKDMRSIRLIAVVDVVLKKFMSTSLASSYVSAASINGSSRIIDLTHSATLVKKC